MRDPEKSAIHTDRILISAVFLRRAVLLYELTELNGRRDGEVERPQLQ